MSLCDVIRQLLERSLATFPLKALETQPLNALKEPLFCAPHVGERSKSVNRVGAANKLATTC